MSSTSMIHVVAFPVPVQSHISAMMHLSKFLASQQGITVSFVNVESVHQEMMKHDERERNINFHQLPFSWRTTGADPSIILNVGKWFNLIEQQLAPALSKLIDDIGPVHCIISDYTLPWTQDVADRFNIPRIVLWSGNATWTSFEYHTPKLMEKGHVYPVGGRVPEPKSVVVDYVGGVSPITLADVPDYMLSCDDDEFRKDSLKMYPSVKRASWVLVNSFYELEKDAFDFMLGEIGPRFVPAGPMFLLDHESGLKNVLLRPQSKDCVAWLNKQEQSSVLYISFGSTAALNEEQFQELAAAIKESGRPFLWVIRSEQERFRENFIDRTLEDQGMIVSWAPQLSVLAHPAVGCFLTHCGWNSILESICNGVPMICWPCEGEQNTNSMLVAEHWKIGVRFNPGVVKEVVGRGRIVSAIETVMGDKEMKLRAEDLKSFGRKAVDRNGEGQSFNKLTELIDHLRTKTCS